MQKSKTAPGAVQKNHFFSENGPFVGVVGTGYWGKNLVRNYYEIGALKVICDRDEGVLSSFKAKYPDIQTRKDFDELLNRSDIEGVIIATPAETHFSLAKQALMAGKHVYVEKPLVLHKTEAVELIRLADARQRILMVGHLLQYHPVFLKLKSMVNSGELGRINYIYSHRLNLGKIRREENILWSFAPHDISMILSLAGERPEAVSATGGNYLHSKIADVTTTHIDFPSGLKAHIFVSWLHPFKEQKLVVVGDRKMAVFDDTRVWGEKLALYAHQIQWESNAPIPLKAEPEYVQVTQAEPLRLECQQFLNSIRMGKSPFTDGREGLAVLGVLKAAQQSLDQNAKKIPFDTRIDGKRKKTRTDSRDFFRHPSSLIDENVVIGQGCKVWHFSHVMKGSIIGRDCNIGQNVVIGPEVSIGDGCKIQNNVSIYKGVTLEDGVFCGPSMVFTNVFNPRAEINKMNQVRPTLVKKGATIGANATIVCGNTIGRYAFIGAGAVVTRDVPDHALVVGNPARLIGWVCRCGERLKKDLTCDGCGRAYQEKWRDNESICILKQSEAA